MAQSSSVRPHASLYNGNLKIHTGGTSGKGGDGGQTGGEGDLGEAAQLAIENVDRFRRSHGRLSFLSLIPPKHQLILLGGTGGEGGTGDMIGGHDGIGQNKVGHIVELKRVLNNAASKNGSAK